MYSTLLIGRVGNILGDEINTNTTSIHSHIHCIPMCIAVVGGNGESLRTRSNEIKKHAWVKTITPV